MNRKLKLTLDIVMGTVMPVFTLNYFNDALGTTMAYIAASLIPVAWVVADLFFITKRFNFITTYAGASAIVSGALTFWFVDGIRFAFKDSIGGVLAMLVFGGSLLAGKPIMFYFFSQALQPQSPKQMHQFRELCAEKMVARAIGGGTILVLGINALAGTANFVLNLRIVVAQFGSTLFNQQVAEVNAITRIFLSIPATVVLLGALAWIRRVMSQHLPEEEEDDQDIWDLLDRREEENPHPGSPKDHEFSGKVIIIGAGAAGLAAGYYLAQEGVDFEILEARSTYGGRMKKTDEFADFPIPLGAEWLSTKRSIFKKIVNDPAVAVDVRTVGYKEDDLTAVWRNKKLMEDVLGPFEDKKFVHGTWLDFFERYILPKVSQHILYESPVSAVDHGGDGVIVQTDKGEYRADRVIVTVPLSILQGGSLAFTPKLPEHKQRIIERATVWDGLKVFMEFSKKFYPTYTDFHTVPRNSGHMTYFDAAYGQKTNKNILGLFAVGTPADRYLALRDEEILDYILDELEEIFPGKAPRTHYVKHIVQNWATEAYIHGAHLHDDENWKSLPILAETVGGKVYFAGDSYTSGENWGHVQDAALSAKQAVRVLLR